MHIIASGPSDQAPLREAICTAGRRLGARGLISAGEGNLSIRLDPETLLITPTGLRKDELRVEDLVTVTLDPEAAPPDPGSRPSSDVAIHRAIYRARADVMAIAHAHLPSSMALTLAGEHPDPLALPETAYHLPVLPVIPFGAMGSVELANRVAAAFATGGPQRPAAVLLERHGAIAVGVPAAEGGPSALASSLTVAVDRLELVDVLCRVWMDAVLLRAALGRSGPIQPPEAPDGSL